MKRYIDMTAKEKKFREWCEWKPLKDLKTALNLAIRLHCDYDFIQAIVNELSCRQLEHDMMKPNRESLYDIVSSEDVQPLPDKSYLSRRILEETKLLKETNTEYKREHVRRKLEVLEYMLLYTVLSEYNIIFDTERKELRKIEDIEKIKW